MADSPNVVDELVVKLELDAEGYKKSDQKVNKTVDTTEKKLEAVDKKRKVRDTAQKKRWKDAEVTAKDFGASLAKLASRLAVVAGIGGGAAGLIGAVIALTGFETNLRRATVATGLSNRELQAWGGTARRLGADAEAGAASLAALAKEQQQFNLTGRGPTIQAFARLGVNAGPGRALGDILGDAQQVYRQAGPQQKQQIEAGLSAQGVSSDIIVMLKSERDAREEFARSFSESATENRKALDSVSDALVAAKNSTLNVANALATVAMPYIQDFAKWASEGAANLSKFVDRVIAAGGGLDGLAKLLQQQSPQLGQALQTIVQVFNRLAEAVDVATYGLKLIGRLFSDFGQWLDKFMGKSPAGTFVKNIASNIATDFKERWAAALGGARVEGPTQLSGAAHGAQLTPQAAERLAAINAITKQNAGQPATHAIVTGLIARGYTLPKAAAAAASIQKESSNNAAAVSPDGGARGLVQWRGPRRKAFIEKYGVEPNAATIDQQLDFLTQNPEEKRRTQLAFKDGGDSQTLGERFSRIVEAHGNLAEDAKRATLAQQIENNYGGTQSTASININGPITIAANTPDQLVNGLQRAASVQNFNSAVR